MAPAGNLTLATKLCALYPSIRCSFICRLGGQDNVVSSQGHGIERPKHSTTSWGHEGFYWHMMITILESVINLWNMLHPRKLEFSIRDTVLLWYKNIRQGLNPILRTGRFLLQRSSARCDETWSALRRFMVFLWKNAIR